MHPQRQALIDAVALDPAENIPVKVESELYPYAGSNANAAPLGIKQEPQEISTVGYAPVAPQTFGNPSFTQQQPLESTSRAIYHHVESHPIVQFKKPTRKPRHRALGLKQQRERQEEVERELQQSKSRIAKLEQALQGRSTPSAAMYTQGPRRCGSLMSGSNIQLNADFILNTYPVLTKGYRRQERHSVIRHLERCGIKASGNLPRTTAEEYRLEPTHPIRLLRRLALSVHPKHIPKLLDAVAYRPKSSAVSENHEITAQQAAVNPITSQKTGVYAETEAATRIRPTEGTDEATNVARLKARILAEVETRAQERIRAKIEETFAIMAEERTKAMATHNVGYGTQENNNMETANWVPARRLVSYDDLDEQPVVKKEPAPEVKHENGSDDDLEMFDSSIGLWIRV